MFKDKVLQDSILQINTLLKAKDLAEILKIRRSMAYDLMRREEIPTVKIGKCRSVRINRFRKTQIEQLRL